MRTSVQGSADVEFAAVPGSCGIHMGRHAAVGDQQKAPAEEVGQLEVTAIALVVAREIAVVGNRA